MSNICREEDDVSDKRNRESLFMMNLAQLRDALREMADVIEYEREVMEDFHAYSQRFGFTAGSNVFQNALEDALRHRGLTLERFRAERRIR